MGAEYLAHDTKLDRKVALKVLPADVATNADRMERFIREAKGLVHGSFRRLDWLAKCHKMVGNAATAGGAVTKATTVDIPVVESASVLRRVQAILGVQRLRADQDLMRLVEERLPSRVIDALRDSGLTDDEVYSLIVPRRTLTHRRSRREALSRDESDRVVRVARLLALCEEVFGEDERAWRWLRDAKRQFQGRAPLDLLVTEAGARLVEELLYRIDEGMAA